MQPEALYRVEHVPNVTNRNAYTGEIIHLTPFSLESTTSRPSIRARRTALQAALLKQVPSGMIQYDSKVVSLHDLGEGKGVELGFHDGRVVAADLVIGADGIRSVRPFVPSLHARKKLNCRC